MKKKLKESSDLLKSNNRDHERELLDVARKVAAATGDNNTSSSSSSSSTSSASFSTMEVKRTLDRMLTLSLRLDTKRVMLEEAKQQRKNMKTNYDRETEDSLFGTDTTNHMKRSEEFQAQMRVCSARISVLNNELSQAKEEMGAMDDVTRQFSSSEDVKSALKYLYDSLLHRAKKSVTSKRAVQTMKRRIHGMKHRLLQSETTKNDLKARFEAKLLTVSF